MPSSEAPIRVLHVISGADIGHAAGGAETYALRLIRELDRTLVWPALFVMRRTGTQSEDAWLAQLQADGVPVFGPHVVSDGTAGRVAATVRGYRHAISVFKPAIVNSHSERGDLLTCLAHLLHPVHPAAVQTVHIDLQWGTRPWFGRLFTHLVAPLCFQAQAAVSETIQQMLDRKLAARLLHRRAWLCYNGIDSSLFEVGRVRHGRRAAEEVERIVQVPEGTARLVIAGRLTDQKGHRYALQAMVLVNRERPAHLLIAGAGPLEAELRKEVRRLGLEDRTHFLGWREDVPSILTTADLLISASLWEGLPTVLLEAMALKVPVVATDVSGSRSLVRDGETGLLVPARDPERLAQAILRILDDPVRAASMADAAHENARQFTMEKTALRYQRIYASIAGPRA